MLRRCPPVLERCSAVDAHVGRTIFTDAICGVLQSKTRILVTHGLQYLTRADRMYVVEGGRVRRVTTVPTMATADSDMSLLTPRPAHVNVMLPTPRHDVVGASAGAATGAVVVVPDLRCYTGARLLRFRRRVSVVQALERVTDRKQSHSAPTTTGMARQTARVLQNS